MPVFHALVDATPGREPEVERALAENARILAFTRCKEGDHDFLVKFEAADFGRVDDVLQTYVRHIAGVKGVEIIVRWDAHGDAVREARERLG
jgi:DNA-binding Lrp family transcriptional regulator